MYTPIIKRLNGNGTTFYTFSSAARDISRCLADNHDKEFVFSHYVCLNLPDILNPQNGTGNNSTQSSKGTESNYTQPIAIGNTKSELDQWGDKNSSWLLAQSLQSYVMNFEERLIGDSDTLHDRSTAERVFWHWMHNMCAMNFKQADSDKVNGDITRYTEFADGDTMPDNDNFSYKSVVKHIGAINVTNNVDIAHEAYTEIYIHTPAQCGTTPTILFGVDTDDVFGLNRQYAVSGNYIYGQTTENPNFVPSDISPIDLSYVALFDEENGDEKYYKTGNNTIETSLESGDGWEGYKTDLEGLYIDFDATSYKEIMSNGNINTIDEFSESADAESFEFNTILVYYDIVDISTGTRTSNLYGVLFVDDVKSDSWDYIQRFPKYKPIEGVQNGNSYGFKLNLRIDIEPNKQGVSTLVNEYNAFSMSLFSDAMAKFTENYDTFVSLMKRMSDIQEKVNEHDNLLTAITNYNILQGEIDQLRNELENANLAFEDRNTILDLIAKLNNDIRDIVTGNLPLSLTIDTDVVNVGYGLTADTNTPNHIVLSNNFGKYALPKTFYYVGDTSYEITPTNPMPINNISLEKSVYTTLSDGLNMIRVYTPSENDIMCDGDIIIYVNDNISQWHNGQVLRIVFPNLMKDTMGTHKIIVKTDYNALSGTSYGKSITIEDFNDKPIIEMLCIDDTMQDNLSFVYDIIK